MLTQADHENYGSEFIDLTQRAAREAMAPEIQRLHAENHHLRSMAQRSQRADIERALDARVPDWRSTYANPAFAQWLSAPDDYAGVARSQLMRHAVANSDASRVVAFYQGFLAQSGHHAPARESRGGYQSRQPAAGGKPIYTRQQIPAFYEARRKGEINDANWARQEAEIMAAANQGRIAGALDKDGNKLTELR